MATGMEHIKALIDAKRPDLLDCIDPNDVLLAQLVKYKVVQNFWCQNLEGKSKGDKKTAIIDAIRGGSVDQFKLFVKALEETNQKQAASFLQLQTDSPTSTLQAEVHQGHSSLSQTSSTSLVKVWSSKHLDGGKLVMDDPKYKDLLNNKRTKLTDTIDIGRLWRWLREMHVLDGKDKSRIEREVKTDQVDELIDYLNRGPMWKMHAFLRACVLDGQDHVLGLLGLNKEDYEE